MLSTQSYFETVLVASNAFLALSPMPQQLVNGACTMFGLQSAARVCGRQNPRRSLPIRLATTTTRLAHLGQWSSHQHCWQTLFLGLSPSTGEVRTKPGTLLRALRSRCDRLWAVTLRHVVDFRYCAPWHCMPTSESTCGCGDGASGGTEYLGTCRLGSLQTAV